MSNALAIAAVTRTLAYMISHTADNTEDTQVTALSPDKAARGSGQRVNLFLYHTAPNTASRNQDIPGRVKPGELGFPPLAVNLNYLITAYGEDDDDYVAQELLGRVMKRLHDRPILKPNYIRQTLDGSGSPDRSELADQIENIRIVPDPLNIEEMSRLWSTFQTQYRVSAAYQAAVVLIESDRPTRSALPVASRGQDDRGIQTDVGLGPVLERLEYRDQPGQPALPAATVGSTITIIGANLPGVGVTVVVRDPKRGSNRSAEDNIVARLQPHVEVAGKRLTTTLDENAGEWPAGVLSLELQFSEEQRSVSSNSLPLALAAEMQTGGFEESAIAFADEVGDRRILSVSLKHPLGGQRRVLLILNRYAAPQQDGTQPPPKENAFFQVPQLPDQLGLGSLNPSFDVTNIPPGSYWLRIRVDGIDSLLMRRAQQPDSKRWTVTIDPRQRIRI